MTFLRYPAVFFIPLFLFLTLLPSCKDPLLEDQSLLLPGDTLNLGFIDTLNLKASTQSDALQQTHDAQLGLLGNMDDPWFGKTVCGVYTQFSFNLQNFGFPAGAVYDSVVLSLRYAGAYGRFNQPVDLAVYELSEAPDPSAIYFSNQTFAVQSSPLAVVYGYKPALTDSVQVGEEKLPPHLRIRLNDALGQKIFQADSSYFVNAASFPNLLKGLYVTANGFQSGNGLVYLDLHNSVSALTVYYHDTIPKTLKLPINRDDATARINHIDRYRQSARILQTLDVQQPAGDSILFVQAGSGSRVRIDIPGLDNIPRNLLIHKAEFVFTVRPDELTGDSLYNFPVALNLKRMNTAGLAENFEEFSSSAFGGVKSVESANGVAVVRYRFNVTRFMQRYLSGAFPNAGFILEHLSPASNSERVLISNRPDSPYSMKLLISYTKL